MESTIADGSASPLEAFLRDYLDKTGGIWEEVEPQVYDMVLPDGTTLPGRGGEGSVIRLTFDPEALPEHPAAQLASFGTPLVDRLLDDAVKRGRARNATAWQLEDSSSAPSSLSGSRPNVRP